MEENKTLRELLEKYQLGTCTDEEIAILYEWYRRIGQKSEANMPEPAFMEKLLNKTMKHPRFVSRQDRLPLVRRWKIWTPIAAAILLLIGVVPIWRHMVQKDTVSNQTLSFSDIRPGGDRAILTLADGSKIVLEKEDKGTLLTEEHFRIVKNGEGDVSYVDGNTYSDETPRINTIQTPRGGKYRIRLPDGTIAWLNSASKLSFPEHFDPRERRVTASGEVYFEVAKSNSDPKNSLTKHIPFIVETRNQEIEVLGTHFNVKAYDEEDVDETTLLEGRVRVRDRKRSREVLLTPGQQARSGQTFRVLRADFEKVMAWQNGDFVFKQEKLADILLEVSRWYNIDFSCPEYLGDLLFEGMVSRKQPLNAIVAMIESTGKVKLKLQGRRLIVQE